eukprot:GGOE01006700.1.p4 GENE.GGOE01006700.1~~GGOE01006700.1.p4  ORF type:complete len:125 (-),score=6.27 GGOE01006700.1:1156-1530(-)
MDTTAHLHLCVRCDFSSECAVETSIGCAACLPACLPGSLAWLCGSAFAVPPRRDQPKSFTMGNHSAPLQVHCVVLLQGMGRCAADLVFPVMLHGWTWWSGTNGIAVRNGDVVRGSVQPRFKGGH